MCSHLVLNGSHSLDLKTGLTPSASGSAYLEVESPSFRKTSLTTCQPSLKLSCTVHGPHPLQRSASFSPQLQLSTRVKFAPFASHQRRGYIPDAGERDLAAHLETAIKGVFIGDRWPKSGVDVVVTVLEGEWDSFPSTLSPNNNQGALGLGMMSVLSGCITVASAAIVDAGIDSVDLVTGGIAAIVRQPNSTPIIVLDPSPSENGEIVSSCMVGYLESRDELTELWAKSSMDLSDREAFTTLGFEHLLDSAVEAARAVRLVLVEAIQETVPQSGS